MINLELSEICKQKKIHLNVFLRILSKYKTNQNFDDHFW